MQLRTYIHSKKIIFFDGDGTLWYPKSTKWGKKPHWLYKDFPEAKNYLKHLTLTPQIVSTLKRLRSRGVVLVALSTHPHKRLEADIHMTRKVKHLRLDSLFDHVYTARPFPWGKGKVIKSILKKQKISKSKAVLVGDSYIYDYLSAKKVGVDCILVSTPYLKIPKGRKTPTTVKDLGELCGV
jgi:FMN phosphatase YigB (HAD superfamily)